MHLYIVRMHILSKYFFGRRRKKNLVIATILTVALEYLDIPSVTARKACKNCKYIVLYRWPQKKRTATDCRHVDSGTREHGHSVGDNHDDFGESEIAVVAAVV